VEIAARDAGISDASFVRLRGAMDRIACAQRFLETLLREIAAMGCSRERLRAEVGDVRGEQVATGQPAMQRADAVGEIRAVVELLAKEWPDEYSAGSLK